MSLLIFIKFDTSSSLAEAWNDRYLGLTGSIFTALRWHASLTYAIVTNPRVTKQLRWPNRGNIRLMHRPPRLMPVIVLDSLR